MHQDYIKMMEKFQHICDCAWDPRLKSEKCFQMNLRKKLSALYIMIGFLNFVICKGKFFLWAFLFIWISWIDKEHCNQRLIIFLT